MKRITLIGVLILSSILAGCKGDVTPAPETQALTAQPSPTFLTHASATPTPTLRPSITVPPSRTPDDIRDTPTPISPFPDGENLLVNGSFDEGFRRVRVPLACETLDCPEGSYEDHTVALGWQPHYLAAHYIWEDVQTVNPCPPERFPERCEGYNDPDTYQGRPEYKVANEFGRQPDRVLGGVGTAQQLFSFYRTATTGIHQVVDVPVGASCQLTIHAQLWVAGGRDPLDPAQERYESRGIIAREGESIIYGLPFTSDIATLDDQRSALVYLFVSPLGDGSEPFSESRILSRGYGYEEGGGIYDGYGLLTLQFTTVSSEIMVGVQARFTWPHAHNNVYFDAASLVCIPTE